MRRLLLLSAALSVCPVATGQDEVDANLDLALSALSSVRYYGTVGTEAAFAMSTTSCNRGSVNIVWQSARPTSMRSRHPFITFLMAREIDGRFEQISDRSWSKHGWLSTNSNNCGTCRNPGSGALLGVNCSDTYGTGNNAERFDLGPIDEIDPWTGDWEPVGSYFDRGDPDVGPPRNMDGLRSLTSGSGFNAIEHRVIVPRALLDQPGARFFAQSMYVAPNDVGDGINENEKESVRTNNMGTRELRITASGSGYSPSVTGSFIEGTVLQRWDGARLESSVNAPGGVARDGRVYVAVKATAVGDGYYRYEFAVHNRDNSGGLARFVVPMCSASSYRNAGMKDNDTDPSNDWTITRTAAGLQFDAPAGNAHKWNSIYNYWVESDAAPGNGAVEVWQANIVAGADPTFTIASDVPTVQTDIGAGCGSSGAPRLFATGLASIPNASFALSMTGNQPNGSGAFAVSPLSGALTFQGCTVYLNPAMTWTAASYTADGNGVATQTIAIPNNPSLQNADAFFQGVELQNGGALLGTANLSNGLRVRFGNQVNGACN